MDQAEPRRQSQGPAVQRGEAQSPSAKGAEVSQEAQGHRRCLGKASHCMRADGVPFEVEVRPCVPGPEFVKHRGGHNRPPPLAHPQQPRRDEESSEEKRESGFPSTFQQCSYHTWCSNLTKFVLRTRTAFAAFLHFSIRISKSSCQRGRLAPAFFPNPSAFSRYLR